MGATEAVERAIDTLGLASRVTLVASGAASEVLKQLGGRFVASPSSQWWWEHLIEGVPSASIHRPAGDGYPVLGSVCPDDQVLLFVSDDAPPPWPCFCGRPHDFSAILGECQFFEYLVAD